MMYLSIEQIKEINFQDGMNILHEIFFDDIPDERIWDKQEDIEGILNLLCCIPKTHYFQLPDGGGDFLTQARLSNEDSSIELQVGFPVQLIPDSLEFVSSEGGKWYYFLLKTKNQQPSSASKLHRQDAIFETVAEVSPLNYVDRKYHDNYDLYTDQFNEKPRLLRRYLSGSFLILNNSSPYRKSPISCDGMHSRMSSEALKLFMTKYHQELQNRFPEPITRADSEFWNYA